MVFKTQDYVRDITESDLGVGCIVDIYINRHDDPNGITTYVVEFTEDDVGEIIFDRFAQSK